MAATFREALRRVNRALDHGSDDDVALAMAAFFRHCRPGQVVIPFPLQSRQPIQLRGDLPPAA